VASFHKNATDIIATDCCKFEIAENCVVELVGDIQGLTPSLLSGQWQARGPLSAAVQMAGIPTG